MAPQKSKKRYTVPWPAIATVLAAAITAVAMLIAHYLDRPPPRPPGIASTQRLAIEEPSDGDAVGAMEIVRGLSPYGREDHVVLVTSKTTGTRYVVGAPFRPSDDGRFNAIARFGGGDAGVGQQFLVEIIAAAVPLPEGPLDAVPAGARSSPPITVIRTH